jgi:hypothetical protein
MSSSAIPGWTTDRERAFIDRLGRHSSHGVVVGRRALLQGYVQSLLRRDRWGEMDPDHVAAHAQRALLEAVLTEELSHD